MATASCLVRRCDAGVALAVVVAALEVVFLADGMTLAISGGIGAAADLETGGLLVRVDRRGPVIAGAGIGARAGPGDDSFRRFEGLGWVRPLVGDGVGNDDVLGAGEATDLGVFPADVVDPPPLFPDRL